jgi:hypothetical protein
MLVSVAGSSAMGWPFASVLEVVDSAMEPEPFLSFDLQAAKEKTTAVKRRIFHGPIKFVRKFKRNDESI